MIDVTENKIDYQQYRFGRAQQRFRGPRPDLSKPYIACIGGSEVYGKFVRDPFSQIIQNNLGMPVANWGTPGAGPSFFLKDPVVLEACSNAKICIISAMGAVAMSNRLYSVFKRRNSRLRTVSPMLRGIYPDVDFSQIRYAHNLLRKLHREDPAKFTILIVELQQAWVARMRELLDDIETTKVLLWMSSRSPDDDAGPERTENFVKFPAFVNRDMFEEIAPLVDVVVEYVAADELGQDRYDGRVFDEAGVAPISWPGPTMHAQTAELLEPSLRDLLSIKMPQAMTPRSG